MGQVETCPQCGWSPPRSDAPLTVRSTGELRLAVARARPGTTILLEDGVYRLDGPAARHLASAASSCGGRTDGGPGVHIRGRGMDERMAAISVSAPEVTRGRPDHQPGRLPRHPGPGRERRPQGGDPSRPHPGRRATTDQGKQVAGVQPCRDGLVACSTLEYTESAPSDYTNGVDIINGERWVVRDNVLRRIRGPRAQGYRAGPADPLLGRLERHHRRAQPAGRLLPRHRPGARAEPRAMSPAGLDHQGGVIRRNAVCNLNPGRMRRSRSMRRPIRWSSTTPCWSRGRSPGRSASASRRRAPWSAIT